MQDRCKKFVSFFFFLNLIIACTDQSQFKNLGEKAKIEKELVQASLFSESFEREQFVLNKTKPMVDILIVVDTSDSMKHHLNSLGQSLADLLYVISDYDWQIGITSADHGDHGDPLGIETHWRDTSFEGKGRFGNLMPLETESGVLQTQILTPKNSNYEEIFFYTLSHEQNRDCEQRPPYCHGPLEQPLRSLKSSMQRAQLGNRHFFRPSADLVTLIITNEDERSENKVRATKAEEVLDTFNKVFGHLDKQFIAFNILIQDEECQREEDRKYPSLSRTAGPSAGILIAELADITGGENISICSKNYGRDLKNISQSIKNALETSISLKKYPIYDTVHVEFDEKSDIKWKLFGQKIIFDSIPSGQIHVSVSYQSED